MYIHYKTHLSLPSIKTFPPLQNHSLDIPKLDQQSNALQKLSQIFPSKTTTTTASQLRKGAPTPPVELESPEGRKEPDERAYSAPPHTPAASGRQAPAPSNLYSSLFLPLHRVYFARRYIHTHTHCFCPLSPFIFLSSSSSFGDGSVHRPLLYCCSACFFFTTVARASSIPRLARSSGEYKQERERERNNFAILIYSCTSAYVCMRTTFCANLYNGAIRGLCVCNTQKMQMEANVGASINNSRELSFSGIPKRRRSVFFARGRGGWSALDERECERERESASEGIKRDEFWGGQDTRVHRIIKFF